MFGVVLVATTDFSYCSHSVQINATSCSSSTLLVITVSGFCLIYHLLLLFPVSLETERSEVSECRV